MRPNLSTRQRTALGFALMILLALVASGMGLLYTTSVERTVSAMRSGAGQIESIANLRLIRLAIAATIDNMLLTRQTSLIDQRLNGEMEELSRQLDALQSQSWGESTEIIVRNRGVVDNLQVLGNDLSDVIDEIVGAVWEGQWAQAQSLRHDDLASLEHLFDESLDRLSTNVRSDVDASVARSLHAENLLRTYWTITALAALIAGSIAAFLTIASIIRPISTLVTAVQGIRDGDLSQRAKVTSRDELGVLADVFNSMTVRLEQTIEELRASEENYRGIFENAVEGIYQTSLEGRVMSANPALTRILGYDSPEELVASLTDVRQQLYVHHEDRDVFLSAILERGIVLGQEFQFYRKDGQEIWVSLNARMVCDEAGAPLFFEGFITDITARKRAEEALRESETRYRAVVEAFDGLIYVCSRDYRVEFMNERFIERTGYDGTGELCYEALHELDSICPWCVNERVFEGETVRWEVLSPKDDRWYYVVNTPIYHADGSMSKQAMILDVTERKRTEEALRESEHLLAEIAANYPNSYLSIVEKDLTIGFTSGQELKKRNLDPKSFEGLSLEQIFGEHTPTVREHYLKTFQGEETSFELFIDDQHQLYQTVPLYDKNGQITRILAVVENITERKQAERELQRSNELLRAIIEAAPTAIIGLDLDGNVQTVWNPAAEKMLGWSAQEAMGHPLPSVSMESQEEFRGFREQIRNGLTLDGVDVRRLRRDGSPIDYSIYASPLHDADGRITGNIAVLVDITERKRVKDIMQARLRLLEFASSHSADELLTAALDEIEALTESRIGFYHFLEADQRTLSLRNWSTNTLMNMCTAEGKGSHYNIDQAGVWVDCIYERRSVIHNDYASLPHRKGMPEGHAPVVREVVVPIFRGEQIRAIIGVGNKPTPYNESDIEIVSQLGDFSWDITGRKRTEEALKEQFSTLRSIIDSANALIFSVDRQYRYTSFNEGHAAVMQALYGAEIETGHSILDYMTVPEDRETAQGNLDRALAGEQLVEEAYSGEELRSRRYFQVSHSPIKTEDGQVIGVAVLAQDMTERKQAEAKLLASEQLFRALVENSPDFIARYDREYRRVYVNPAIQRLFAGSAEGVLGQTPAAQSPLYAPQIYIEHLQHAIETATESVLETPYRTPQGEMHWGQMRFVPEFDSEGKVATVLAIGRDVHEIKENEQRFRMLAENFPDFVVRFDRDGRYTYVNPAIENAFGMPAEAIVGKTLHELPQHYGPKQVDELLLLIRRAFDGGTPNEFEEHWHTETGERIFEVRHVPEKDAAGNVVSVLSIARDVTESKRAEAELKKHRNRLEELVRERTAELTIAKDAAEEARQLAEAASLAKNTFLANMSHELRTPLNAILGYAQVLQRRPLDADVIDSLRIVQRSGEHLLTLINDILDIARIEAGRMELYPSPIHFPHFLEHIASIIGARAQAKGLTFGFEAASALPTVVRADETRLRQVLLNLLDNAVKFTDAGQVTLRVQQIGDRPPNGIPGQRGNAAAVGPFADSQICLRFEVEDSGTGIPPDQVERIFQPFEQAGDLAHHTEGTGLGLAISRQLVGLMGGELQVKSEQARGSTFWFEVALPVLEMVGEMQPLGRFTTGYKGPRRTVLVVDDIPSSRAVLVDMLQPLAFEVLEAADGQQALHLARELRPDLILMDRWMPVLDGFAAAQRLRQAPELAEIPIIAVSASVSSEDQAQSRAAGFDAFLPKPVHWAALAALLEEHLELEWEYKEIERDDREGDEAVLVPPPQEEIAILHDLARRGNLQAIQERAVHLETLGEQYVPFARKLCELVRGFEEKEILALVERFTSRDK